MHEFGVRLSHNIALLEPFRLEKLSAMKAMAGKKKGVLARRKIPRKSW